MGRSGGAKRMSAAAKLREALCLENNFAVFEEFRNNIRLIGKEFLDMNETACRQEGALVTIRRELAGRYPDILGGENTSRLDLALDLVKYHHANSRCVAKKKLANEKARIRQAIKQGERGVSNVENCDHYVEYLVPTKFAEPSSSFGSNRPTVINGSVPETPNNSKTRRTDPAVTTPGFFTPLNSKPSRKVYPATPKRPIKSVSQTTPGTHLWRGIGGENCEYESTDSDQPLALRRRQQLRSAGPPTPSDLANVDVVPQPNEAVYHFLDKCVPSMAHLFEGFIEYGCNSEEFLLGISSWPPTLIANFIHNVSRMTGTYISEMETDIIQVQFMSYYKD